MTQTLDPAAAPWLPHTLALRRHGIRTTHAEVLADLGPDRQAEAIEMTAALVDTTAEEVASVVSGAAGEPESEI